MALSFLAGLCPGVGKGDGRDDLPLSVYSPGALRASERLADAVRELGGRVVFDNEVKRAEAQCVDGLLLAGVSGQD